HRRPRLRPHRQRLKTGHGKAEHASPAITHQLVTPKLRSITHARESGLVNLLADGPAVEILADAGTMASATRSADV
ncbi:hypothetical protein AB0D47_40115, partial [Streptomyces sp. NPDC048376]